MTHDTALVLKVVVISMLVMVGMAFAYMRGLHAAERERLEVIERRIRQLERVLKVGRGDPRMKYLPPELADREDIVREELWGEKRR